jgi:hypothetical protein
MKTAWRKSTRSGNSGGNCVEVRVNDEEFQVRDSKLGDDSPIFDFTPEDFRSLLLAAR